MFDRILIANRGEIACRIIGTARRLGITTVVVYSGFDADAAHVAAADEALPLGGEASGQSYLDAAAIVDAARNAGVQAVHPGYGFLSENPAFAEGCAEAGLVFIGPPADAIRAMGSKSEAKSIMETAEIAPVPGYHGERQEVDFLRLEAQRIGYPVLIKAIAGGGGKGMRLVRRAEEFDAALAAARREASSSFGDDRVLVEKYIERPRHVEIQVFADRQGNAVHLFERDCSIQRRHQKIVEEAPAAGITPELRARMGQAAVSAAKAIGYIGAGTVEFIVDPEGRFYFMEMNTRLQVEHPVTEMITGQDLVEWQLRVAAGEPLPLLQEALTHHGHAFEARVYAEDPQRDFLPATGVLHHLRFPPPSPNVRVDAGVREGDRIGIHYDPMLAKVIVWDHDREAARRRLCWALAHTEIVGVTTNLGFLAQVANHTMFAAGGVDAEFVDRERERLLPRQVPLTDTVLALASLHVLLSRAREAARAAERSPDPGSPWHRTDGWRLNEDNYHTLHFHHGTEDIRVTAHYRKTGYILELPAGSLAASGELEDSGGMSASIDHHRIGATVVQWGEALTVLFQGNAWRLDLYDPASVGVEADAAPGTLRAPMPGRVLHYLVGTGEEVRAGAALVILEAMKMEHTITAPSDGIVSQINFPSGVLVEEGAELLVIDNDKRGN